MSANASAGASGQPASILIVKPSSFGDVVHTLPAVARLKTAWPESRLAWVVNGEWAPLLEGNPFVDEIVTFPRAEFRGLAGVPKFFRWCHEKIAVKRPDLTVDFQGLLRSAWISKSSGARRNVGMSDAREGARWLYDEVVPVPAGPIHAVERYLETARWILRGHGSKGIVSGDDPVFPVPVGEPPDDGKMVLPERFLLLHPFSRGEGKSLTVEQVSELCGRIAPTCAVLAGKCADTVQRSWPENALDLLNSTSLLQLIWLIRRAVGIVTVDSGPAHLAAALGRPMVAIHTWSDPRLVGPYRGDAWVWKNGQLLQVKQLRTMEENFFQRRTRRLTGQDLAAIARLATSF